MGLLIWDSWFKTFAGKREKILLWSQKLQRAKIAHAHLHSKEREEWFIQLSAVIMAATEEHSWGFETLLNKNVPHILEGIFFSLDYPSFRTCLRVSKTWYELLTSDSFQKKAKSIFRKGLLEDEKKLRDAARKGDATEIRVVIQSCPDNSVKTFSDKFQHCPISSNQFQNVTAENMQPALPGENALKFPAAKSHDTSEWLPRRLLFGGMVDVNRDLGLSDPTPLCWAAHFGHGHVVRLLLDRGADPRWGNEHGQSPLRFAAEGHYSVMSWHFTTSIFWHLNHNFLFPKTVENILVIGLRSKD